MSQGYTRPPEIEPEVTVEDDHVIRRHPAFGSICFTALHGNRADALFGVDIEVRNTVRMTLSLAHEVERNHTYHSNDRRVVEVEMSEAQFAQAIASMNHSEGVPVTIRHAPEFGKIVAYPRIAKVNTEDRLKDQIKKKVDDELKRIMECFAKVAAIANGHGAVSKRELHEAVKSLQSALGNLPSNMAYFNEMMEGNVEKILSDAKIELHATAMRYGAAPTSVLIEDYSDTGNDGE